MQISQLSFQRPETSYLTYDDVTICNPNESTSRVYVGCGIAIEFIVDVYVTIRLVQILRKANHNVLSLNMECAHKRTLFTSVMYWNFLRLFVSVIFHSVPIINQIFNNDILSITSISLINIIISYVITVDAEIVQIIKSNEKKNFCSEVTKKSITPNLGNLNTTHCYDNKLIGDNCLRSSSLNKNYDQIEDNKIEADSIKRLSFFEWANTIVDNQFCKKNQTNKEEK